ncbi:glucokinase [Bacillus tianshenii]|uniref:Glucokinase n=1 Tax=Sutcliffiella tianshenii TaxID=1463404 RepID=A0ABS2P2R5_9BACI|nr:ROK family protein [Bacillus tianshenii]MBM7621210.1 glucokinase [Bacillus tianshenii]
MTYYIGVDLGGTNIKAMAIDNSGEILHEMLVKTEADRGSEHVISKMKRMIEQFQEMLAFPIKAVGVTVPGVLGEYNSVVELMPNFPDNQWRGIPLKAKLEACTGLPIFLLNDARAATYGEKMFGATQEFRDFIYIAIGTGVGGGIVSNGELLLGSRGVAGEFGHQVVEPGGLRCGCGNRGCLETVASGPAIATSAIRCIAQGLPTKMRDLVKNDLNKVTTEVVTKAALEGDIAALDILEKAANGLATAIRNSIALLNPEAICFGGGVSESGLLLDLVKNKLSEENILFPEALGSVKIVKSKFDYFAGAIGVAAWARTNFSSKHLIH